MDKCNSPPKESSVANLSQNDKVLTLSPVLGSGQSVKKFRKRTKKPCKTVKQKLEIQFQTQNESLGTVESEDDSVLGLSLSRLDNQPECVQDRIRQLEALQNQRIKIVQELSFQNPEIDMCNEKPTQVLPPLPAEQPVVVKNQVSEFRQPKFLNKTQSKGFTTGLGKPINLSLQQEQKSWQLFEDILNPDKNLKPPEKKLNYLRPNTQKPATGKTVNIFENENFGDLNLKANFQSFTSAKAFMTPKETVSLSSSKVLGQKKTQKTANIFENENFGDLNFNTNFQSFMSAKAVMAPAETLSLSNSKLQNQEKLQKNGNIFANENFGDLNLKANFQSFKSTKNHMTSVETVQNSGLSNLKPPEIIKNIFENESFVDLGDLKLCGFQSASLKRENPEKIPNDLEQNNQFHSGNNNIFKGESFDDLPSVDFLANSGYTTPNPQFGSRKLTEGQDPFKGFSCKERHSSLSKLHKIETALILLDPTKKCKLPELNVTPVQTKKRLGCRVSPTVQLSEPTLKRARLIFEDLEPCHTSTPLKKPSSSITPISNVQLMKRVSKPLEVVLLTETAQRDVKGWLEDLIKERQRLEERLRIVNQRHTILTNQKTMMEFSSKARVSPGVLYKAKTGFRKPLMDFLGKISIGKNGAMSSFLEEISPQNAHLIRFTVNDSESHLTTEDGAVIVPDAENRVGLAEIEFGFKSMDSVDVNLLPKNWIQNHFKWIIWKLASYDRMFASHFDRCLTVENVVQQLKYRYDREIDKAERPIVRRILEKDDTSQRRMVLCVANIKLNTELELTDGWYPIRTLVDAPLGQQIKTGKINIGQKLLIYGAELKNCEQGCHPLEAPPSVHLQINFNTTRRALPWCKLGVQKQSGPFLLPLSGISFEGGKIGRIQCVIVRVYPLRYLDKSGGSNVWRNRKAQEHYNPQANLSNIEDPQVLYDMLQNSADPEGLQEMLSVTQKTALYNYSVGGTVKTKTSNVIPLLVMKMADAHPNGGDVHDFRVWRPTDCHFDELKEGAVVTVFNVCCTPKWGLSAGPSTQFKREPGPEKRFEKFRRKVTEIAELPDFRTNVRWSYEFDTVGIVVKKTITETDQEVWLADVKQKLLRITINDSPSNILVLDGISDGQLVSVCNLTFVEHWYSHCQAAGGWSVIFTRYTQYSHLREGLDRLEAEFSQIDKTKFLEECRKKVMAATTKHATADEMECSQITVTDRALLECLEKLN